MDDSEAVEQGMLTVADVAARLRVAPDTVRTWLRTDQLRGYNFGGQTGWRIPLAEVDRLLASKRPESRGSGRASG